MNNPPFDPTPYLLDIKGNEYLPVNWRLYWFRTTFPNATIDTEILHLDTERKEAVVRATVVAIDRSGVIRGRATGIKTGTVRGKITDYVELGETGAIGRALAAIGFGTQFAGTEYNPDEEEYYVDSPIEPNSAPRNGQQPHITNVVNMPVPPSPPKPTPTLAAPPDDDDTSGLDPDALVDATTAQDLRGFAKELIDSGLIDKSGVQSLIIGINERASRIEDLTNEEAGRLEADLDSLNHVMNS